MKLRKLVGRTDGSRRSRGWLGDAGLGSRDSVNRDLSESGLRRDLDARLTADWTDRVGRLGR
jgi:hypothetical protein